MSSYVIPKEHNAEIKINRWFYFKDIVVLVLAIAVLNGATGLVHTSLKVPFYVIGMAIVVYFILPSRSNPGKRVYQATFFGLQRNHQVYEALDLNQLLNEYEFEMEIGEQDVF